MMDLTSIEKSAVCAAPELRPITVIKGCPELFEKVHDGEPRGGFVAEAAHERTVVLSRIFFTKLLARGSVLQMVGIVITSEPFAGIGFVGVSDTLIVDLANTVEGVEDKVQSDGKE